MVAKNGNTIFDVNFNHGIMKVKIEPTNATLNQIINQDPLFETINTADNLYNFRLQPTSPAIDKGINTSINIDLDGLPRPVALPDLGAFEVGAAPVEFGRRAYLRYDEGWAPWEKY